MSIEKLIYGGDGLARNGSEVVFVPLTLPGERVRVSTVRSRPGLHRAEIDEVLEPSPDRQPAPCPHFGICGGCHYQHTPYESQLRLKVDILREVLARIGKVPAPENIGVISGPPLAYRNRAQFHLHQGRIGFHKLSSRDLAPADGCLVISPKLAEAYAALRRMLADRRFPNFIRSIELFTDETKVQLNVLTTDRPVAKGFFEWCAKEIPGLVSGALDYDAAGYRFRVSHGSFFQVNRFLLGELVEAALGDAAGEKALDLYAGAGLFSIPLAKRFSNVSAVESGNSAWRDLIFNAERAQVQVRAIKANAEDHLREHPETGDFVLADPPRSGLGKAVTQRLLESKPRRIVIVSCDPATLARDLAALGAAYEVEGMTMIDLFPQTFHLETITRLRLR